MKIVQAKLVKRKTNDGLMEMQDHVHLGKIYEIDIDSVTEYKAYNTEKDQYHTKQMVMDVNACNLLPFECLEVLNKERIFN